MTDRVYVGGTFDLFHAGHVRFLECVRRHGPVIVALNTDEFAARYKRSPIMSLAERQAVVAACKYVEYVDVNEGGEDSSETILRWRPRYIAHGDDWKGPALLEQLGITQDFLDDNNVEMLYVPYTAGISSSEIERRVIERSWAEQNLRFDSTALYGNAIKMIREDK
jgi:glycerol-3-phosphate cytidylyltransferase